VKSKYDFTPNEKEAMVALRDIGTLRMYVLAEEVFPNYSSRKIRMQSVRQLVHKLERMKMAERIMKRTEGRLETYVRLTRKGRYHARKIKGQGYRRFPVIMPYKNSKVVYEPDEFWIAPNPW